MKPKELLDKYGCGINGNIENGYYDFTRNMGKDCVVAYSINDLGLFVLIKSTRKFMPFISLKNHIQEIYLDMGAYNYKLKREDRINFTLLNDLVIVDEKLFDDYRNKMLLKCL